MLHKSFRDLKPSHVVSFIESYPDRLNIEKPDINSPHLLKKSVDELMLIRKPVDLLKPHF
ncbi:MAG: hypothetical protein ACXWCZ_10870 [Flavisolibacter sp.]